MQCNLGAYKHQRLIIHFEEHPLQMKRNLVPMHYQAQTKVVSKMHQRTVSCSSIYLSSKITLVTPVSSPGGVFIIIGTIRTKNSYPKPLTLQGHPKSSEKDIQSLLCNGYYDLFHEESFCSPFCAMSPSSSFSSPFWRKLWSKTPY